MNIKSLAKKFLKSKTALILTLAVLIRFSFAPFTEHRYDMYIWRLNQAFAYQYGVNPLNPPAWIDKNATVFFWSYPPLWLFCLLAVYPIYAAASHPTFPANVSELWRDMYTFNNPCEAYHSYEPENLPLLDLLIKTPLILSDLAISLLLLKIIRRFSDEEKARRHVYMWILNPFVIFISAVWGMFDTIPTLFTLLATWLLLEGKSGKSAVSLSTAALFKMYPIIFAPILALLHYKKYRKPAAAMKYLLVTMGLTVLTMLLVQFCFALIFGQEPFITSTTMVWLLLKGRASPDWYGSNIFFGLTPLNIMEGLFKQMNIRANVPISPILICVATVILLYGISRKKNLDVTDFFAYITLAHLAIYLTYTVVNEQYLIWILPFLLVLAAIKNSSKIVFIYWTISLTVMLFIFAHYGDLSYFISPYFVPGYPGYLPELLLFGLAASVIYVMGILFILEMDEEKLQGMRKNIDKFKTLI
ncbi:MAG: hypothetical protein QW161_00740 [Candidatus Bathyarchaeia archaeon]